MKRSAATVTIATLLIAGCGAVGLGGPGPERRDALALRLPANTTAEELAARIQQGGYEYVMLSAQHDSAWLAGAATRAGLQMTRPGRVGDATYVFFGPKAIGDTTHSVQMRGGGYVRLHDALFQIDKGRHLDLILARFDNVPDLREGVRALLSYIAKDVSGNAALLLGVEAPSPQLGDSVAVLIRAAYTDTRECAGGASANASAIRLFYGPEVRIRCERAAVLSEPGGPVSAQFELR